MKKRMKGLLAVLLLLSMLPVSALAISIDCNGNHSWGEWNVRPEPTCTEAGKRIRWCNNCQEYQEESVPALGHEYGDWETTKEPTCTEPGSRRRICTRCKDTQTEQIAALGHSYEDWKTTKEPACTESGSRSRSCTRCGDTQTEAIAATGHKTAERVAREATCAADGLKETYCTICGTVTGTASIKKTGSHTYGEWTVTRQPSCTEKGSRTRTCTVCGDTQTEAVAATGHTLAERVAKEATCGANGTKETYCTVCGTVTDTSVIKATGDHTYGEWVVTKEATCKQNGSRARTCIVCGSQQTESISKSTAHQYGDWAVTRAATCTSEGVRTRTCANCGLKQTEVIPMLEHDYSAWTVQTEATCTRDGKERRVCNVCGLSKHRTIPKLGHTYSNWEITEEATDHTKGKRTASCDRCGKKVTESFYPDGTLYKGADNPVDQVKNLQQALADLKLYKGKISGKFDNATAKAVSAFEKNYLGMKGDGVAWPKVLKSLFIGGIGGGWDDDEAATSDTSGVKLVLEAERVSPAKDFYSVGDEITIKWTLTNQSAKDDALSLRVYTYMGMKPDKKKDVEIAQPETLVPGESMSDTYIYTVTKDDAIAGKFTVGFIARGKIKNKNAESNKAWFTFSATSLGGIGGPGEEGGIGGGEDGSGTGSSGGWTPPAEQQLAVAKKVANKPANNFCFVKGETIRYTITVANTSKEDVDSVILTDKLFPGLNLGSFSIKAGGMKSFSLSYKVQATDIPAGEIINTAIATYTGSDGKLKSAKVSAKAPVWLNTESLYIYKTVVSKPANGLFYLPGEIITYEITVVNPTGKTFTDVRLYDDLNTDPKEPIKKIGTMNAGEVRTVTFRHHTSRFEAKIGKIVNYAWATCVNPKNAKFQEASNVCVAPAGLEDSDGVIVRKTIISRPENGRYYEDAEEIRYMIDVTNNTIATITDLDVRDALAPLDENGFRTVYAHETLAPGETKSYPFSFIVGPKDVENTYVTNTASAYWTLNGTDYFETWSDPVLVPTSEATAQRVPKKVTLDGGTCENQLTAVGSGVTEHDVTECADHALTAAESKQLTDSQDYAQAKTLWDEEIDALYAEWAELADAEGARNAEDEQAAFMFQLRMLEASLGLVCDEAEVNAVSVEERMNKCVRLCYELHSAPETRSDSLDSAHANASGNQSAAECSHEATYLADGSAHVVDCQCESHRRTMQLTSRMLESAGDGEDKLIAWQRAQGNWLLELNAMYDTWYLASDETRRAKIAADRISFDRLIEARRKTLADLYPDDPAAAAEVLANMIMERTELICRVLHSAGILKDE